MTLVFVYGTLMAEQVLARVLNGEKKLEGVMYEDAVLEGHRRYKLKGRDYPGVMAAANSSVAGKLVSGIDSNGLASLDFFEGEEYERQTWPVKTSRGTFDADVYIWKDRDTTLAEEWQLAEFVDQNLDKWVADVLEDAQGMGGRFWKTS